MFFPILIFLYRLLLRFTSGSVHYIGGSQSLPAPLSPQEEAEALARLQKQDHAARQTLIEHNLRLVVYIARRFENTGVGLEDLISIGTVGLIKAVNTFRTDKKIKLATYASRCIENEILMFLRRNVRTKLEVSFDEPVNVDWDGNALLICDILGTDPDMISQDLEDKTDKDLLYHALITLDGREKTIMQLRFGLFGKKEKTQKEVADMMGISQSYISRLEKRILHKLRVQMQQMQ